MPHYVITEDVQGETLWRGYAATPADAIRRASAETETETDPALLSAFEIAEETT